MATVRLAVVENQGQSVEEGDLEAARELLDSANQEQPREDGAEADEPDLPT